MRFGWLYCCVAGEKVLLTIIVIAILIIVVVILIILVMVLAAVIINSITLTSTDSQWLKLFTLNNIYSV